MTTRVPPSSPDRLSHTLKQLSESAARLNSASDEFSKAIVPIEAALKKLNLGVTAWHAYYSASPDESGNYWQRRIGYAKIDGKWGLALSTISGNVRYPDDDEEQWLFTDAPRSMRIEAIDHIPALLEELVNQANKIATDLQNKTETARELSLTIATLAKGAEGRR
jgi:prefoldin subunit 5